jgi:hypothetical protein
MLTTQQIIQKYGSPGDPKTTTSINLPYPMRLAWAPETIIKKTSCHTLVSQNFLNVFNQILSHYGYDEIKRLGIDLFGGIVNVRPMRGTESKHAAALRRGDYQTAYTYLSRHAWGIAIDLDPARNGLKTKWVNAQFSKPEYKAMVDIFYVNNFMSYGKDRNYDAMHFEINI